MLKKDDVMKTTKQSPEIKELIVFLEKASKKNKAAIWKDMAMRIARPRKGFAQVNVGKIDRYTKEGNIAIVPGKVLGSGTLSHSVDVAALGFSMEAERKISSQGSCMNFRELVQKNPKGTGIIILE